MMILSPSILAADFLHLERDIREVDEAGTQYIHFDVMDGVFVPAISFGMPLLSAIRKITGKFLDVHLMIVNPEKYIEEFVACGADGITVHLEACKDVEKVLQQIHNTGKRAGLAISPDTPVESVIPYLEQVEMILVMTVYPGRGGQKFIDSCGDKVKELRKILVDRQLEVDIEVDGGIKQSNVKSIMDAGANVIVAGSAVFEIGQTEKHVEEFLNIFKEWEASKDK